MTHHSHRPRRLATQVYQRVTGLRGQHPDVQEAYVQAALRLPYLMRNHGLALSVNYLMRQAQDSERTAAGVSILLGDLHALIGFPANASAHVGTPALTGDREYVLASRRAREVAARIKRVCQAMFEVEESAGGDEHD